MVTCVYPGSFDPVSLGHLDIIRRASEQFEKVFIVVATNPLKKESTFTTQERIDMLRKVTSNFKNVTVDTWGGLIGDYAKKVGASLIIKGIRNTDDFEHEISQYQYNRTLHPTVDTLFFFASKEHIFISSSGIRELASFHGDISPYVPKEIISIIKEKYRK